MRVVVGRLVGDRDTVVEVEDQRRDPYSVVQGDVKESIWGYGAHEI